MVLPAPRPPSRCVTGWVHPLTPLTGPSAARGTEASAARARGRAAISYNWQRLRDFHKLNRRGAAAPLSSCCCGLPRRAWLGLRVAAAPGSGNELDQEVSVCAPGRSRIVVKHLRCERLGRFLPLVSKAFAVWLL